MTSDLKAATARANGAKSRGPKTAEGREKSSRNSLAHGLTSRHTVLLDVDSRAQFQEMLDDFDATYEPATPAQKKLVDEMAANRWRLDRFWMIETALLEDEMCRLSSSTENPQAGDVVMQIAKASRSLADGSQSLALIRRYQSTLSRDLDRAYRSLRELQTTAEAESPSQAIQPAPSPPEPPQPEEVAAPPEAATSPASRPAPGPENRRLRNEPTGLSSPARRRRWLALFHPILSARRRAA